MPQSNVNYTAKQLLGRAREIHTCEYIAQAIGVSAKTVARWEKPEHSISYHRWLALKEFVNEQIRDRVAEPETVYRSTAFSFVDLFAGIGGIRLGFESVGGKCVFTSEWNDFSKKTYLKNFGDNHAFEGDITKIDANDIPDHDVLLGGFPCQPFSIAGVSKKNSLGKPHGFECTTQGTLFFDVARIIAEKKPVAFLLENVKNLRSHDQGNTFRVIMKTLREELGYEVHFKIIDGQHFTPQHRERIIIVGFREQSNFSWDDLQLPNSKITMSSVLHKVDGSEPILEHDDDRFFDSKKIRVQEKYTLTSNLWQYLQDYAAKHRAAGNGFGFGLVTPDDVSRTLSARYYKDGSEILVSQGARKRPRRLTPRECARLMGFPDNFVIPVSDTQAYRQFGNSVVVPVMKRMAELMYPHIEAIKLGKSPVGMQLRLLA